MKEKNYEKVILTIFLLIFGFSSSLGVLAADASLEDVEWQEENNNDPEIRYHDYRAIGEGYMDGWYIHDFTTLYRNY